MRFMGDAPLKGQSELDVLYTLLKVSSADFAGCSLSCSCGQFPHLSAKVAGHWGGKPQTGCILQVGRGLGKGLQAFLQGHTLFFRGWRVPWALARDLACPPLAVWGP